MVLSTLLVLGVSNPLDLHNHGTLPGTIMIEWAVYLPGTWEAVDPVNRSLLDHEEIYLERIDESSTYPQHHKWRGSELECSDLSSG